MNKKRFTELIFNLGHIRKSIWDYEDSEVNNLSSC
ncbi:unnamed protein product [Cuscuta europaea]|uniref:Uncharacterized protein n=1 Tax=Cuscuta europaea TaxID=41803 RepID=A0A9P0Z0M3_CUSEU|nr:unnamed protein product [Cuscuta europaea]